MPQGILWVSEGSMVSLWISGTMEKSWHGDTLFGVKMIGCPAFKLRGKMWWQGGARLQGGLEKSYFAVKRCICPLQLTRWLSCLWMLNDIAGILIYNGAMWGCMLGHVATQLHVYRAWLYFSSRNFLLRVLHHFGMFLQTCPHICFLTQKVFKRPVSLQPLLNLLQHAPSSSN